MTVLIQCHIFNIISRTSLKEYEALATSPPIHIYITDSNNRLVFKIKDGYKLKFQTLETMKSFGSLEKSMEKIKNRETITILKVIILVKVEF